MASFIKTSPARPMTGKFIVPGPLCASTSRPIDPGTRCRTESPPPGYKGKTGSPNVRSKAQVDNSESQRQRLQENQVYAQDANVKAFLTAISKAEGGDYNLKFGGVKGKKNDPYKFDDFSTHPGAGYKKQTAAGMYQINDVTWRDMGGKKMGITDFLPEHQDLMAIEIMRTVGALEDVIAGDLVKALPKVAKRWAALPQGPGQGNAYPKQPYKPYEEFVKYYREAGGKMKADTKDTKGAPNTNSATSRGAEK